jgi:hypothetical protein
MVQVPTLEDRLRAAEVERGRLHRLEPSQPLKHATDAAAFVRERRIVTETGHAGVPVLAHTIAGRELVGSWMASPEVYRIYDLLNELAEHDVCYGPLLDGKVTIFDPSLAPAVQRIATDPGRRAALIAQLSPAAAKLLRRVERDGDLRMDHSGMSTKEGRAARLRLERHLLVVSQGIHTDRGSHTSVLRPWSESQIARRCEATDGLPDLESSMDLLVEAAVRAAVLVTEREARKWFDFAAERIDLLVDAGRIERLIPAPRERCLLPAGPTGGSRPAGARRRRP